MASAHARLCLPGLQPDGEPIGGYRCLRCGCDSDSQMYCGDCVDLRVAELEQGSQHVHRALVGIGLSLRALDHYLDGHFGNEANRHTQQKIKELREKVAELI